MFEAFFVGISERSPLTAPEETPQCRLMMLYHTIEGLASAEMFVAMAQRPPTRKPIDSADCFTPSASQLTASQDPVRFYPLCANCVEKVETIGDPPPEKEILFVVQAQPCAKLHLTKLLQSVAHS